MNHSPSDDDLRQVYAAFRKDHDRLRTELLSALSDVRPTSRQPADWLTSRRTWLAIAASICVTVALACWFALIATAPRTALALDGVYERFQKVRRLHVKGWTYYVHLVDGKEAIEKLPIEWYAERPARYWQTLNGVSQDGGGVRISHGYLACDGSRSIVVSDDEKTVVSGTTDPLATELRVEWLLHHQWIQQLIQGPTAEYTLVGTETLGGRKTLKYERVYSSGDGRTRHVVWLNPTTGLPVRSTSFTINADGHEHVALDFEQIEINTLLRPEMFSFEAPAGYQLMRGPEGGTDDFVAGSAGSGRDRVALRHSFAIDNLAVLVCWNRHVEPADRAAPIEENPIVPQAALSSAYGTRECDLHAVQTQTEGDRTWQWSLVVPRDRRPIGATENLKMVFADGSRSMMSFIDGPLRLDDERLGRVIARLQGLATQPFPAEDSFTLVQLRWQVTRILSSSEHENTSLRDNHGSP
ncbi:MAG: LolA family protein [Planctomycetaceae bacterium]